MARTRSAGYDDQREMILAQAAALFARQGYTATSMNEVAAACGLSKATLYHYVRDKHELLLCVAETHVARLESLVDEVSALHLAPRERLRELITRFVLVYADAQNQHRVLTEDVRFLDALARDRVLGTQRRLVDRFADAVQAVRPELGGAALTKPLTMLLFGMINWMFTWLRPEGRLDHAAMAPLVVDLFLGGLAALTLPSAAKPPASTRSKNPQKETHP
jgi:TetR/AcrR family transcriptional regulator